MDKKRSVLKTLCLIFVVIAFISGLLAFANSNGKTIITFSIISFIVTFIGLLITTYGEWRLNKTLNNIGKLLAFFGFLWIFYYAYNLNIKLTDFEAGFYVLILGFIIFITYLLSALSKDNNDPYSVKKKDNTTYKDITGKYLICNYIDGIEYDPKLNNDRIITNKLSSIVYDLEENNMTFYIGTHMAPKVVIDIKNLMNVLITKKEMNSEIEKILQPDGASKKDLIRNVETSTNISPSIDSYQALETLQAFEIEITYFDDKITRKMVFITKENPYNFFKDITEKVTIKQLTRNV